MICPACAYEFDPAEGLECPRCGETVSCSAVSCAECEACSGVLGRLRNTVTDRLSSADTDAATDDDSDQSDRTE